MMVNCLRKTDGVAMGSPLGPLMANVFMCHLEENLARDGMVHSLYKKYVDDTLARMPKTDAAADFKFCDYTTWTTSEPEVYNRTSY